MVLIPDEIYVASIMTVYLGSIMSRSRQGNIIIPLCGCCLTELYFAFSSPAEYVEVRSLREVRHGMTLLRRVRC